MAVQQEPEPHHLAIESNGLVAAFPLLKHISLVAESRRLAEATFPAARMPARSPERRSAITR